MRVTLASISVFFCCFRVLSQPHSSNFPTEERVRSLIKEGMDRAAVIRQFGDPYTAGTTTNGTQMDTYLSSPAPTIAESQNRFCGFQVSYKDNKVLVWHPIYSDQLFSGQRLLDSVKGRANAKIEVAFYIVEYTLPTNGVYFDTPDFPRLGFIRTNADAVFTNIQSAELKTWATNSSGEGGKYGIDLSLNEADAKALKTFTSQNIGREILIMVDHTPISAPILMAPIGGGEMEITLPDKKKAEEAMATIRTLIR